MERNLHIEGLDLLRKATIIGLVGALIAAAAGFIGGMGMAFMAPRRPLAAVGAAIGMATAMTVLSTIINLVAWYFRFRGWGCLCETKVEDFFCTTYTAVKWGLLVAYLLMLIGGLAMMAAGPRIVGRMRPGGMGGLAAHATGGAAMGLGGLIALVVAIILLIAYFKVARIYDAPNVKWGAILSLVGALLSFTGVLGAVISLIGLVLLYMGLGTAISNVQSGAAPKK